jgi:pectate lyase
VSRRTLPALTLLASLAAAAGACGASRAYPYEPRTGGTVSCPTTLVGYAAVGGSDADGGVTPATNGGNDSTVPPVRVTDVAALAAELQSREPRIIFLDGMLAPSETIKVTLDKDLRNGNKTLIGVGASSGLTGAGLDLSYSDNVIIRNLKITKVSAGEGDAVTLLASNHIWIDHCDLSSEASDTVYDGLIDISHGSANVTISWTRYHDHWDTGIVGHTDNPTAQPEDAALQVTFHHNLFLNVNSGPRVRFGTAHVFSNHFQNVTAYGVASLSFAKVLVDHNFFEGVATPLTTSYQDMNDGTMTAMSNSFSSGVVPTITAAAPPVTVPYAWSEDSADSVPAIVAQCAGTGKITFN